MLITFSITVFLYTMLNISTVLCLSRSFRNGLRTRMPTRQLSLPTNTISVIDYSYKSKKGYKEGSLIVHSGSIVHTESSKLKRAGDEVLVLNQSKVVLGRGIYNPYSQLAVRLLAFQNDPMFKSSIEDIITSRINQAVSVRKSIFLPRPGTDAYRLVNGEGDGLGGLVVDVLGPMIVVQSSAIWIELHRCTIETALRNCDGLKDKQLLWRRAETRLMQDGWDKFQAPSVNSSDSKELDITTPPSSTSAPSVTKVVENDVIYGFQPETDQKTGFYCDQRENRQYIHCVSRDKTVLDLYCYSGGFTLNALLGGAKSVTSVDSSLRAIECLWENIYLNDGIKCRVNSDGVGSNSQKPHSFSELRSSSSGSTTCEGISSDLCDTISTVNLIKGEATQVMNELIAANKRYDIVICDPPKLAPRVAVLGSASQKYKAINSQAMRLVSEKGGLLLSCTCSAAMTQSGKFEDVLLNAAREAGRRVTVLRSAGAGADHTLLPGHSDGHYLTAVLLYVH